MIIANDCDTSSKEIFSGFGDTYYVARRVYPEKQNRGADEVCFQFLQEYLPEIPEMP